MKPSRSCLALVPLLLLAPAAALAQPQVASADNRHAPPALFVEGSAEHIGLTRVAIDTRIVGHLAETRMTLTFSNTTARRMAGDLYVPLPADATVSGYALDVAGRMVDGVVVPKDEARRIFEQEVRKGVDPGLVEWTRGNVFKTRVFPIPPNGSRTVRLSWVAPLDDGPDAAAGATYALPLAFKDELDELSLRVEVVRGKERPVVSGAGPLALAFDDRLVAEAKLTRQAVVADLRIALPDVGRRPVQVERSASGDTYFSVDELVPPTGDLPRITPRRVRVLWDASLSRASARREDELALLKAYLATAPAAEVEVVVVRNAASAPKTYAASDTARLLADLAALDDDGGTQLARLSPPPGARPVDVVLVFTDGLSTFGDDTPAPLGAPTWVISSSTEAGHDTLRRLAADNGGAYLDLARVGPEAAVAQIGRPVWSLQSVVVEDGQVDALLPATAEPALSATFVTGVLKSDKASLRLSWGVPGQAASVVKRYEVAAAASGTGEVLRFAWAEKKLADLLARPAKNADAIVDLGKAHGIVTPGTSLLVLESLDQYLVHRVRPPATWPELRADWDREVETRRVVQEKGEAERLDEVAAMWKAEVAWYEAAYTYPPDFRYGGGDKEKRAGADMDGESDRDEAPPRPEPSPERTPARTVAEETTDKKSEKGKDKNDDDGAAPEPGVAMTAWDPQTPWTRALKAAPAADRVRVYQAQRAAHGTAPSFYLDCADVFVAQKDEAMALQVLSNIAELRLDDPALLRVLAHRLAQLGQLDTAITIFAEVLRLRPEEPQSQRDLALVYGQRAARRMTTGGAGAGAGAAAAKADWQAALDHLAAVVKKKWDRFDQIELIALTELNDFWRLAKPAGAVMPLDTRFVHPMELDTRIAMTWDADQTDMDLHVIEPSREEAYYGHNLTTIGGKVSRDFTQGYGPEVYGLRRAMHGTYKVKTHFFGSSAASLIGAVTLQVDVFTNWGRPNEKVRSMTLRLTEKKEEFVVGELEL